MALCLPRDQARISSLAHSRVPLPTRLHQLPLSIHLLSQQTPSILKPPPNPYSLQILPSAPLRSPLIPCFPNLTNPTKNLSSLPHLLTLHLHLPLLRSPQVLLSLKNLLSLRRHLKNLHSPPTPLVLHLIIPQTNCSLPTTSQLRSNSDLQTHRLHLLSTAPLRHKRPPLLLLPPILLPSLPHPTPTQNLLLETFLLRRGANPSRPPPPTALLS